MNHTYSFEKLEVWQEARKLVVWIYAITHSFPPDEKFGLTMQLRRAAISVFSNHAEGSARNTAKAYFSQLAYSSLVEVLNQLIIANDLDFIDEILLTEGRNRIEQLTQRIAALRRSQLEKLTTKL